MTASVQNQKYGWPITSEIRLGTSDYLYDKFIVMKLLLEIPSKIYIYYYCKMVPWFSLKMRQSTSRADFRICSPCFSFHFRRFAWCALAPSRGQNRRERARAVSLMLRIYRRRFLEFSTKKYVLFTTYFMSSFQITWYFQRTLWPRFDFEKQLYIWVPFYYMVCIYS